MTILAYTINTSSKTNFVRLLCKHQQWVGCGWRAQPGCSC